MNLRPYQEKSTDEIRDLFRAGKKRVILVSPCGSGKTVTFSFMTSRAVARGKRVVVMAHRAEILDQISRTLASVSVPHETLAAGMHPKPGAQVLVASVQTLARRIERMPAPDFVIVDECFPAGTLVDGRPIQTLTEGDLVTGLESGVRVIEIVKHVLKRRPTSICRVVLEDGNSVVCTPNHPFLTASGWKQAHNLTSDDMVVTVTPYGCLRHLREVCEESALREYDMQVGVFSQNYLCHIQAAWRADNAVSEEQRYVKAGSPSFGFHEASGDGLEAFNSGWKRERANTSRTFDGLRFGMEDIGNSQNWCAPFRIPEPLQGGRGEYGPENCNRDRRNVPQRDVGKGERRQKGSVSCFKRVVSVEIQKPTSDGTFGGLCPDGFVYNLEVSGSHTYTANGVVVHNCHHSAASQWSRVFATWSDSLFIGVTATPERLDGKGLGNYYEAMVRGPDVQTLIDGGFLARPVYFAPQHIVDASTLRKTAGDYNKADAAELVDKPTITGDAVAQYRRHANGRTAIVFCISIDHAEHVAASFSASGIPAASIDGTMSGDARREVLRRFAAREILVLTSCELVSEGFDLPAVGAAILLRPTASLAMHLQQVGRALRPKPDGSDAKILDHVGNCLRHGLAEDYREWSLDGFASKKTKAPPLEVAQCPKCYCMFRGATCPECGNEREMKGREIDTVAGELVEVSAEKLRAIAQRKAEERQCRTFEDFVALGKARGFKPGWAHFRWQNSWQRKAVAA